MRQSPKEGTFAFRLISQLQGHKMAHKVVMPIIINDIIQDETNT